MRLVSVNIGKTQAIEAKSGQTVIYKRPTEDSVQIGVLGLSGDAICDTKNHGGVDQAVYVYGVSDYVWWSETLGRTLLPGTFGENLTVSELESPNLGDRLQIGTVVLEVTSPRIPCVTLAVRMDDPMFVKRFRQVERPGVYCRVLQTGRVQVGDEVTLHAYKGETISAVAMFRDFYKPQLDETTLRRHLAAPISVCDREGKEAKLRELLAGANRF